MRWAAALVALCGCNQVFGLDTTQLFDAPSRIDAPPDAPPVCPAPGAQFRVSGPLVQVVRQSCTQFSASLPTQIAVANCYVYNSATMQWQNMPYEGRLDDSMGPVKLQTTQMSLELPRVSPEGDELYFRAWDASGTGYVVEVFQRQTDGTWIDSGALPIAPSGFNFLTQTTRGPHRHIMLSYGSSVKEFADDGTGAWPQVGEILYADLGVQSFINPTLTGDGLRLVFGGYRPNAPSYQLFVADRRDIADAFAAPTTIVNMPDGVYDAFLPEDCSRLYFSALSSIFTAQLAY